MKSASGSGVRRFPALWLVPLLAVLVVLAIFLVSRKGRKPVPALPERERSELQLRDDRLFDGEQPFTGIVVEHYGEGVMKSRSVVSNGLLEGLSQGWFTNGVLQVTEHFVHGVSDGQRIKYHPSGAKLSIANIVNGQLEGLYERFHENGALAEKVYLTNGVPNGESLAYHPDGSLKARVILDHGQVVEQQFWEPGQAH